MTVLDPVPGADAERRPAAVEVADGPAIEALLAALPLLGTLRCSVGAVLPARSPAAWHPPSRWRLLDPWLEGLAGRAGAVEAEASIAPWGIRERLSVLTVSRVPLIRFELLPGTDFCEWERLFAALSARDSVTERARRGAQVRRGCRLRPLGWVFTGRVQMRLGDGTLGLRLVREGGADQR